MPNDSALRKLDPWGTSSRRISAESHSNHSSLFLLVKVDHSSFGRPGTPSSSDSVSASLCTATDSLADEDRSAPAPEAEVRPVGEPSRRGERSASDEAARVPKLDPKLRDTTRWMPLPEPRPRRDDEWLCAFERMPQIGTSGGGSATCKAPYRRYFGVADGMPIARVWTCRYSK